MSKKISLGAAITLIAIASAITFILTTSFSQGIFNNSIKDVKQRALIYKKLDTIDAYVRENYVGNVDQDNLLDAISEGYITVMNDKYARYLTADEQQQQKKKDEGFNVGVGITVKQDESGYIAITAVTDGSPAQQAGIKTGQQVVAVEGKDVLTEGYKKSISEIVGEAGTAVKLTVRNEGVDKEVSLTRKEIEINSVSSKMINNIGYIKITEFNSKTETQFNQALKAMTDAGAKGLVFDVRNNGGGLLTPTLKMLDTLLPEGTIATATYKDGKTEVLGKSDSNQVNLPMAVIVNSRTASAAELFSSALRDYKKAELVGTKTYGKGVMQQTFELKDGSSITFTTAKYQTSQTPNYDGIGLKPNYEVALEKDTADDLKALDENTDPQLKKALEIVKVTIK